jgi:hypothetical protein
MYKPLVNKQPPTVVEKKNSKPHKDSTVKALGEIRKMLIRGGTMSESAVHGKMKSIECLSGKEIRDMLAEMQK